MEASHVEYRWRENPIISEKCSQIRHEEREREQIQARVVSPSEGRISSPLVLFLVTLPVPRLQVIGWTAGGRIEPWGEAQVEF